MGRLEMIPYIANAHILFVEYGRDMLVITFVNGDKLTCEGSEDDIDQFFRSVADPVIVLNPLSSRLRNSWTKLGGRDVEMKIS